MSPKEICQKWVAELGAAWHPDNESSEYAFSNLPGFAAADYDRDMDDLFGQSAEIGTDPYALAIEALETSETWQGMVARAVSRRPNMRNSEEQKLVRLVSVLGPKGR